VSFGRSFLLLLMEEKKEKGWEPPPSSLRDQKDRSPAGTEEEKRKKKGKGGGAPSSSDVCNLPSWIRNGVYPRLAERKGRNPRPTALVLKKRRKKGKKQKNSIMNSAGKVRKEREGREEGVSNSCASMTFLPARG